MTAMCILAHAVQRPGLLSSILETLSLRHVYEDVQDGQVLHAAFFCSFSSLWKAMRREFVAHAGCWDHTPATQEYGRGSARNVVR